MYVCETLRLCERVHEFPIWVSGCDVEGPLLCQYQCRLCLLVCERPGTPGCGSSLVDPSVCPVKVPVHDPPLRDHDSLLSLTSIYSGKDPGVSVGVSGR